MVRSIPWCGCVGFLVLVFVPGCGDRPADPAAPTAPAKSAEESGPEAEKTVRGRFKEVQEAVKLRDTNKVWGLLSKKSRAEAEQSARDNRASYEQADPQERTKLDEALGLSGPEVAGLTGPGMLRTKRFLRKYNELPESEVEKVTVQGDTATVYWLEPDGDHEKTVFLREDGQWKAWLWIPRASKQP
jgi:hypothetical protein